MLVPALTKHKFSTTFTVFKAAFAQNAMALSCN